MNLYYRNKNVILDTIHRCLIAKNEYISDTKYKGNEIGK